MSFVTDVVAFGKPRGCVALRSLVSFINDDVAFG